MKFRLTISQRNFLENKRGVKPFNTWKKTVQMVLKHDGYSEDTQRLLNGMITEYKEINQL